MAVYTKINKKDISHINKNFKIEKIINFKGIKNLYLQFLKKEFLKKKYRFLWS